jgi:diguanylate cyclase (GGDEF)-like protein
MSNAALNEMREIQKLLNQVIEIVGRMPAEIQNAMQEQLERTPIVTDYLTGAYNRLFFYEVLRRETARADRHSTPLSLLIADIDTFKLINDTFGQIVGNKVLTQIAKILGDTVGNADFVFRCGPDEFGIVLPGTDLEGAMRVAEKILRRVETGELLASLGYSGRVTVCIGLSEYRRGSHLENLVAEAEQALYKAERTSKNCARAFRDN